MLRPGDRVIGPSGVAEEVCMFSDLPVSVTEASLVVSRRGCCQGGCDVTALSIPSAINFNSFAFFFP